MSAFNQFVKVVICFQISIFEPLKTAGYLFLYDYQWFIKYFRKRKNLFFNYKSRLNKRDL